jgi:hypothetical protein
MNKWSNKTDPMTPAELREALAEILDQLEREPDVLAELEEAVLARDLATMRAILVHLRDFFTVLEVLVRLVTVVDPPAVSSW